MLKRTVIAAAVMFALGHLAVANGAFPHKSIKTAAGAPVASKVIIRDRR